MIWSDKDFLAAHESGTFGLNPWHPEDLTPNGIDLRSSSILIPSVSPEVIEVALGETKTVTVPPMTRFILGTQATMAMPQDAVGSLWIRSSYARKGVIASFGKVDAGFRGNLTLAMFYTGHEPLELVLGDRCAQMVLENLHQAPSADYGSKSGNFQDQSGITLQ